MELDLRIGIPFSKSLEQFPRIFPAYYRAVIRSSELTGGMPDACHLLSTTLEKNWKFHSRIKGALIYPAFTLLCAVTAVFGFTYFLFPKLTELLKNLPSLPLLTRIVLSVGGFLTHPVSVLIMVLAITLLVLHFQTVTGRQQLEHIYLKTPILSNVYRKGVTAIFCHFISMLLNAGIPLVTCMRIAGDVTGSFWFKSFLKEVEVALINGEHLSDAMELHPALSQVVAQFADVGMRTGRLPTLMTGLANMLQADVDMVVERVVALAESIVMVFLGGVVAIVLIAIFLPLYESINSLR